MDNADIAEALYKAAEYMGEHGKCENMYMDKDGRVCALGAVAAVTGSLIPCRNIEGDPMWMTAQSPVSTALAHWVNSKGLGVTTWSDMSGTEDVILGIKEAAYAYETGAATFTQHSE